MIQESTRKARHQNFDPWAPACPSSSFPLPAWMYTIQQHAKIGHPGKESLLFCAESVNSKRFTLDWTLVTLVCTPILGTKVTDFLASSGVAQFHTRDASHIFRASETELNSGTWYTGIPNSDFFPGANTVQWNLTVTFLELGWNLVPGNLVPRNVLVLGPPKPNAEELDGKVPLLLLLGKRLPIPREPLKPSPSMSRTSATCNTSRPPLTPRTLPYPNTSVQNLEREPNVNTFPTAPPGHPGTSSVQRPLKQTAFWEKCQQLDHDTFTPTVAGGDAKHGCLANTTITSH